MWNVAAKQLQQKYHDEFHKEIDPFKNLIYHEAREARNCKRKELQALPEKRRQSSAALTTEEYLSENNNFVGRKYTRRFAEKIFVIASVELAWRGSEATNCFLHFFRRNAEMVEP